MTIGIAAAPAANAAIVTPTGGQAEIAIDFQHFFFPLLAKNMSAVPNPPAYLDFTNGHLVAPVTGGVVETRTMLGTVNLGGSLTILKYNSDFSVIEKSIDVTNLKLLNGRQLAGDAFGLVPSPAADLKNRSISNPNRSTTQFNADDVFLSGLSAPVLNLYFDTDFFSSDVRMGTLTSTITH